MRPPSAAARLPMFHFVGSLPPFSSDSRRRLHRATRRRPANRRSKLLLAWQQCESPLCQYTWPRQPLGWPDARDPSAHNPYGAQRSGKDASRHPATGAVCPSKRVNAACARRATEIRPNRSVSFGRNPRARRAPGCASRPAAASPSGRDAANGFGAPPPLARPSPHRSPGRPVPAVPGRRVRPSVGCAPRIEAAA